MAQRCNDVLESLAAYALGALEVEERAEVEAHLEGCARCRRQLHTYTEAAAALGEGAPQVEPPPELRQRLLERAAALGPATRPRQRLPRWPLLAPPSAAAVAAGVLLLALLATQVVLLRSIGELRRQNAQLTAQLAEVTAQSALLGEALQLQRSVVYLSAAPGTTVATLRGDALPQAYGMFMLSASGRVGYLVAGNLEPPPQGRVYQAWLIQDGQRTSGGTFQPDASGWAVLPIRAREEGDTLARYQALGVTVEPAGGSPGPTGERVLFGPLR